MNSIVFITFNFFLVTVVQCTQQDHPTDCKIHNLGDHHSEQFTLSQTFDDIISAEVKRSNASKCNFAFGFEASDGNPNGILKFEMSDSNIEIKVTLKNWDPSNTGLKDDTITLPSHLSAKFLEDWTNISLNKSQGKLEVVIGTSGHKITFHGMDASQFHKVYVYVEAGHYVNVRFGCKTAEEPRIAVVEPSVAPSEPPKSGASTVAIVVFILIIVALVGGGGGGYWWWKKKKGEDPLEPIRKTGLFNKCTKSEANVGVDEKDSFLVTHENGMEGKEQGIKSKLPGISGLKNRFITNSKAEEKEDETLEHCLKINEDANEENNTQQESYRQFGSDTAVNLPRSNSDKNCEHIVQIENDAQQVHSESSSMFYNDSDDQNTELDAQDRISTTSTQGQRDATIADDTSTESSHYRNNPSNIKKLSEESTLENQQNQESDQKQSTERSKEPVDLNNGTKCVPLSTPSSASTADLSAGSDDGNQKEKESNKANSKAPAVEHEVNVALSISSSEDGNQSPDEGTRNKSTGDTAETDAAYDKQKAETLTAPSSTEDLSAGSGDGNQKEKESNEPNSKGPAVEHEVNVTLSISSSEEGNQSPDEGTRNESTGDNAETDAADDKQKAETLTAPSSTGNEATTVDRKDFTQSNGEGETVESTRDNFEADTVDDEVMNLPSNAHLNTSDREDENQSSDEGTTAASTGDESEADTADNKENAETLTAPLSTGTEATTGDQQDGTQPAGDVTPDKSNHSQGSAEDDKQTDKTSNNSSSTGAEVRTGDRGDGNHSHGEGAKEESTGGNSEDDEENYETSSTTSSSSDTSEDGNRLSAEGKEKETIASNSDYGVTDDINV